MITHATAQGIREYQEDRYLVYEYGAGTMMAVFDGHGGDEAADCCVELLPKLLEELQKGEFPDNPEDIGQSPVGVYRWIFHRLHAATQDCRSGTTATMAFVPKDGRAAYMANLGDSPLVWSNGLGAIVAKDHNVRTNEEERRRAINRGGRYEGGYVFGPRSYCGLQMSRSLGDRDLALILSREPDFHAVSLDQDSFILVATDGVVDPSHGESDDMKQIIDLIRNGASAQDLVDRAVQKPTRDNATAILWRP